MKMVKSHLKSDKKKLQDLEELYSQEAFDTYHTFSHHFAVWTNALNIIVSENIANIGDVSVLKYAVFLHDLDKGNDEYIKTKKFASKYDFIESSLDDIFEIIDEHSFGKVQSTISSQILYDADKLELLSIARWEHSFDLYSQSLISKEERDKYVNELNKRIPLLRNNLYFESSNKEFIDREILFIAWLKGLSRWDEDDFLWK